MDCVVRRIVVGVVLAAICGCASHRSHAPTTLPTATTQPSDPALLTLDQIKPVPVLATPSTQPTRQATLEALQLYAQARAAQITGDRAKAALLLRQALDKDPDSFDLNYALGIAYLGSGTAPEAGLQRLEQAAQLEPDHLEVHLQLGQQYLARGDYDKSLNHLRLAIQTRSYRISPEDAACVDFFLARALQQKGYDTAAIQRYEMFLGRMDGRLNVRGNPQLFYLVSRPELIEMQAGELCEKHGRYPRALELYRRAVEREPNNFGFQAHIVRVLLKLKRIGEARELASDLVAGHRASRDSIELLKEAFGPDSPGDAVIRELRRILSGRPGDGPVTFALAEALMSAGQPDEAEKLLLENLRQSPGDGAVVSRLVELYLEKRQPARAAQVIIEALARRPESLDEMERIWERLLRSSTRLRLPALQAINVPADALASKLYWIARMADLWSRGGLARSSLEQAVAISPPFPPAYRQLIVSYLRRPEWSEKQREQAATKLIEQLRGKGSAALAEELNGMLLLSQRKPAEAAESFRQAIAHGQQLPAVKYFLASALSASGKEAEAEGLLKAIVREWPRYADAQQALFQLYLRKGMGAQAIQGLQGWLAADPASVHARILQIEVMMRGGLMNEAEASLLRLFSEESDNPTVISEMARFYIQRGREEELLKKLEDQRSKHPENRLVVQTLVELYANRNRPADATRVLEEACAAAAGDPDQLYYLAHLYDRLDQKSMTEKLLQQVLTLDPRNSAANNDLGYMWADDGKNIARAEDMIRIALEVEPDNSAYLDSLGWVLYKRGKFAEAKRWLSDATAATDDPDAVVLDHLGDALYRLGESAEALKRWQRALERLGQMSGREELKKLLLQLQRKIRQQRDGQPVNVAPVVAEGGTQAKN